MSRQGKRRRVAQAAVLSGIGPVFPSPEPCPAPDWGIVKIAALRAGLAEGVKRTRNVRFARISLPNCVSGPISPSGRSLRRGRTADVAGVVNVIKFEVFPRRPHLTRSAPRRPGPPPGR
jgi:hypothetical protein